jgi:hypothetical protein
MFLIPSKVTTPAFFQPKMVIFTGSTELNMIKRICINEFAPEQTPRFHFRPLALN